MTRLEKSFANLQATGLNSVVAKLSGTFIAASVVIHTIVPLAVATTMFSGFTLLRVITYQPKIGVPLPDPGFAPAGNSLIVFVGMEVMILLTALSWVIPFLVIAVFLTLLSFVTVHSRALFIVLSAASGSLLAAGWLYVVRNGFDVIAQTLAPLFAIGFVISSVWAASIKILR